ncbi:MAG TPA: LysM peptidoglycan-binding domain-containing protein [Candidatus Limnocylindrales bacterium]
MAAPSAHDRLSAAGLPAADAICPYLMSADRAWRAAVPSRDLRCTAVEPASLLTPDKQRRLCLVAEHRSCATFQAAAGDGDLGSVVVPRHPERTVGPSGRPIVRTAPVVLDNARLVMALPAMRLERGVAQGALIGLMALAFVAILFARLSVGADAPGSPGGVAGVGAGATATPTPSATAVAAAETPTPERTLVPSNVEPTAATPTEVAPSSAPEATPEPPEATSKPETYKVKRGDTLSEIAAEYGTTARKLMKLNDITDPTKLRVGQVLELP